jgi:hypothetical protein
MPQPLYLQGNIPGTHWIGGWVDLRAGLNAVAKKTNPYPGHPACSLLTVVTELCCSHVTNHLAQLPQALWLARQVTKHANTVLVLKSAEFGFVHCQSRNICREIVYFSRLNSQVLGRQIQEKSEDEWVNWCCWSWNSSVSVVTRLRAERPRLDSRQGRIFSSSPPRPDLFSDPPSLLSNG